MSEVHVLVVDGREVERAQLKTLLVELGHVVTEATSADDVRQVLGQGTVPVEVVLVSARVAGTPAAAVLKVVRAHDPQLESVVTWDDNSRADALDSLQSGAVSLVRRPYDSTELACAILAAADRRWLRAIRAHEEALRAVLASVEPEKLPKAIVTAFAHALGADRATLLLASRNGLAPAWAFGPGMPLDALADQEWLGSLRAPAVCARVDGQPLDAQTAGSCGHEVLCPLSAGDRGVGVLWAVRALRPFVRREIEVMQTFVSTARTALENAQFRRHLGASNQLATVGQVAAGVANELRSPLGYLKTNSQRVTDGLTALQQALAAGSSVPETLMGRPIADVLAELVEAAKDAGSGAARLGDLVSDIDAMVKSDDCTRVAVDLNEAVRTAVRMTTVEMRGRARVICRLGDEVKVVGSRTRLTQVVVNLMLRAAQAVGAERAREGCVTISTRRDGGRVLVEVSDNGPGLTREAASRLFDLHLDGREPTKAGSFALHLCQEIARRHGGQLRAWGRLGAGSTLVLELPAEARAQKGEGAKERAIA